MKKAASLLIALAMLFLLAACGGDTSTASVASASSSEAEDPRDSIKIGVIHVTDPAEGSGYTFTHDTAITSMQHQIGLADKQIVRKINIADGDAAAAETAMRECIADGCNIIFATSYGYMDTCAKLAAEFPDVLFCHASGSQNNETNFTNYFGRIYQARYLAGIAAGLRTATGQIGYVAAMGKENSEVTSGLNAFALGVASVNAEAMVHVRVIGSWSDAPAEGAAAQELIDGGCDVIAQHCDSAEPMLIAQQNGVYGIGYNSDMSVQAPGAVLLSVMWYWDVYYTQLVQSVLSGTFTTQPYIGSMEDRLLGITVPSELCAEGTTDAISAAAERILYEGFAIFEGAIPTNDGTTVGSDGTPFSDEDILQNMNWYYANIVEA